MFSVSDTVVAIATPPGRGGIGVVRLAGPDAPRIAMSLAARALPFEPRHATFARIVDPVDETQAHVIDQVVVTWFAAPHSYTGDDVVEIGAHGSPVLLQRIVELAVAAGARLAEPGEFTLRAYLNGRIDLVQAEAVADLADAVTPLQARAAMDQLEGTLTTRIGAIDRALFDLSAKLEASLDFPDEGFHFITREETTDAIAALCADLEMLVRDGRSGRVLREGRLVVVVGRPNAGKSSLFNAIVGASRAIVTDVAGTTRDVLTERVDIGGVPVTMVDTAGLRVSNDAIEAEGVARAMQAQAIAALTIVAIDGSDALADDDRVRAAEAGENGLVVITKSDLARAWPRRELGTAEAAAIDASVVTGEGLEDVRHAIVRSLTDRELLRDTPAISNARHLGHVEAALAALTRAREAASEGATEELVLADLNAARSSLEAITGRREADDLLVHIFSRFCVGK